jgi:hypothetical protein
LSMTGLEQTVTVGFSEMQWNHEHEYKYEKLFCKTIECMKLYVWRTIREGRVLDKCSYTEVLKLIIPH